MTQNADTVKSTESFSQWFIDTVIAYQVRHRQWFLSASEIADMVGVVNSTVYAWKTGTSKPRREQCSKIAEGLEEDLAAVLEAAGHTLTPANYPIRYSELAYTVLRDKKLNWSDEYRKMVTDAVNEASGTAFLSSSWKPAADALLRSEDSYGMRAERIAQIVQIWRNEHKQLNSQTGT